MTESGEPLRWVDDAVAVAVALVVAVVLLPTGMVAVADGDVAPGWQWLLWSALVVLHLTLVPPLVNRQPVAAFAVGCAAMLVLVAAPDLSGTVSDQADGPVGPILLPTSIVWFILLYGVSARSRAPWPSIALAGGLVGCLLTVVRLWSSPVSGTLGGPWGWRLFLLAAVVGGTLAAWALGRYRATRLAWSAETADRAAAQERRRIAREMHDVVAHSLAVVVAQAEGGRMLVTQRPEQAGEVLGRIAEQGREALTQMRGLLGILGEDDERSGRAAEPPQPGLDVLPALVGQVREAGRRVSLETFGDRRPLAATTELVVYRVVQEALTNVVKHTDPSVAATVTLDWTDELTVTVTDDGPKAARRAGGRGLLGMRERVEAVGGELDAGPVATGGWRVRARIPV